MFGEERLAFDEDLASVLFHEPGPFEQFASAGAPDQVADVVADDRRYRGDHDHEPDPELPVAGEDPGGDESGLARNGNAGRLGAHEPEEDEVPEVGRELDQGEHHMRMRVRCDGGSTGPREPLRSA